MTTPKSIPGISNEDKLEYAELLQKKKEIEENLVNLERQIYLFEGKNYGQYL